MLMTDEQRFDRARDMAAAAGDENQTEAEFTAAYAAAEKALNLPTGFDIRFYNSKAEGEQVTLCAPVDADTVALYRRDADGRAELIGDFSIDSPGLAYLANRIENEARLILFPLLFAREMAGAKC